MNNYVIRHSKHTIFPRDFVIFWACLLCSGITFYANGKGYLKWLFILPLTYGICYLIFLAPLNHKYSSKTTLLFTVCELLRCVFMPVFISFTEYSGFGTYSTNNEEYLTIAVFLMAYELIVVSLFLICYIQNSKFNIVEEQQKQLTENKYAIYLIIGIGIAIYLLSPDVRRYINFFSLSSNAEKVRGLTAGSSSSLFTGLITIVHDAFLCFFIIVLDACGKKHLNNGNKIYIWIATFVGLITVTVIFGESRAGIIYTLYAVICCLTLKFPEKRKSIRLVLLGGALVVIIGMTVYRLFAVYAFSSYSAAIANGGYMGKNYYEKFFEAYLLGPQSIAASVEFKNINLGKFTIERFFFDLFRPFMGFNLLLQNTTFDTSITMYNSWLTGVAGRSNGYFLQITGQCYCYVGFLLSPLFVCFFMCLSVKIEKWMKKTKNLFVYFFLCYVFIRMSTCVLGGTMSGFITSSSMTLLVCGFFVLMQKIFGSLIRRKQ